MRRHTAGRVRTVQLLKLSGFFERFTKKIFSAYRLTINAVFARKRAIVSKSHFFYKCINNNKTYGSTKAKVMRVRHAEPPRMLWNL
jgi:hypothetical protein